MQPGAEEATCRCAGINTFGEVPIHYTHNHRKSD